MTSPRRLLVIDQGVCMTTRSTTFPFPVTKHNGCDTVLKVEVVTIVVVVMVSQSVRVIGKEKKVPLVKSGTSFEL
jgi:hypothetical protein